MEVLSLPSQYPCSELLRSIFFSCRDRAKLRHEIEEKEDTLRTIGKMQVGVDILKLQWRSFRSHGNSPPVRTSHQRFQRSRYKRKQLLGGENFWWRDDYYHHEWNHGLCLKLTELDLLSILLRDICYCFLNSAYWRPTSGDILIQRLLKAGTVCQ